jgi:formyl-CoA transferase
LAHQQVAARELIVESDHPVLGKVRNVGLPIRFAEAPRSAHRAPPLLASTPTRCSARLATAPAVIADFKAQGVIATANMPQADSQSAAASHCMSGTP